MTTTSTSQVQVLNTWDDLISFVLMTIFENKSDEVEVARARIECEKMEKTEISAVHYKGPAEGEKFFMPLGDDERMRLQNLLVSAKNPSNSFITISRKGVKLIWSVSKV